MTNFAKFCVFVRVRVFSCEIAPLCASSHANLIAENEKHLNHAQFRVVSFVLLEVAKKSEAAASRPKYTRISKQLCAKRCERAQKRASFCASLRAIRIFSHAICGTISLVK